MKINVILISHLPFDIDIYPFLFYLYNKFTIEDMFKEENKIANTNKSMDLC